MFPKLLFFDSSKTIRSLCGLFLVLLTGVIFYLDIITHSMVAFDIFYFPSIMLMTWYLGGRAGVLMTVLTATMWFIAQEDVEAWGGKDIFYLDGVVHFIIFSLVCGMTQRLRKKAIQLEEMSQELARSNFELEIFAGSTAHDLQSPLAAILGFAELLGDKLKNSGDETAKDFTKRIINNVKRMSAFIKALLNYANVKKPEASTPPVELEKIVEEVMGDFHSLILQKKAEVTCSPLPVLSINPGLAGLLFQNLIGNALKYCEKEPRIHISAVLKKKAWFFSIQDNGIGIPEESLERVFIMFEKLATRQKYPGSGIGLATCQKIVERYGGRMWVESTVGEGSTFFFTLPAG